MTVIVAGGIGIVGYSQTAGAQPKPTIDQVQAKVDSLQSQVDEVGTQMDAVQQKLDDAQAKVNQVKHRVASAENQFLEARAALKQVAVASYMDQGQSSFAALLSSGSPETVMRQASLLQELGNIHLQQANKFLYAAQQVEQAQAQYRRSTAGIQEIKAQLADKKKSLNKLLAKNQATLDSLNLQEQEQVAIVGGGGTCNASDPFGTGSAGLQAVKFAYGALCLPYAWGGTGPDSYDCSGLTQAAWASAGVSIPRDTYSQWAALPHVSKSSLQAGDLVFFEGLGHVGIYVGHGMMIDAPQTGEVIKLHALDQSWYAANYYGAARP